MTTIKKHSKARFALQYININSHNKTLQREYNNLVTELDKAMTLNKELLSDNTKLRNKLQERTNILLDTKSKLKQVNINKRATYTIEQGDDTVLNSLAIAY